MRLLLGKLIGSFGGRYWGQVHDFAPEEINKLKEKGRMVATVGIDTGGDMDQVEVVKTGREILSRLHELYFGQEAETAMEAVKKAVERLLEEFGEIDIAVLVFIGQVAYVGVGGKAGVWVKTESKQGFISRANDETSAVKAFSGKVKTGMCFVLGNGIFWGKLDNEELVSVATLATRDMDEAMEVLTQKTGGDIPGVVATVVHVSEIESLETDDLEVENGVEGEAIESTGVDQESQPENVTYQEERKSKFREKIENWIGGWRRIYIRRGDRDEQRKKTRYFGLGLLVLLLLMVGAGQVINEKNDKTKQVREQEIARLASEFRDAIGLVDLNPSKSKEILEAIKPELVKYEEEKKPDQRIVEIKANWEEIWLKAQGIVSTNSVELIDLTLVREGMGAGALAWSDDNLYVLDPKGYRVVEVNPETGAGKVVGGGESLVGARLLSGYPGKVFVISNEGVIEIGVVEPKIEADETVAEAVGFEIYGGNAYLLDPTTGEIWRYAGGGDGFGTESEWLADEESREGLKKGSDLAIDGSIWVLEAGGIEKFTRGVREAYELSGTEATWGTEAKIYTDEDTTNLYVLDAANSRVVILGKDGKYLKQFVNENWKQAKDILVREDLKKIFLTVDGKVLTIDL